MTTVSNYTRKEPGLVITFYLIRIGDIERYHRLDGPAWECMLPHETMNHSVPSTCHNKWYYMGERINCNSQEEFEGILTLMAFW